jgi:peptide deformylase
LWGRKIIPFAAEIAVAVRPIIFYPNPLLKSICAPVTAFDEASRELAADLLDTMRAAPGVGITAAHIGILQRVTVIELDHKDGVRIYVNPEILWLSPERGMHTEGSVSMPGAVEEVERPASIRFHYQDLGGIVHEEEAGGFLAVCIHHEIDQLDGIFWLQHLSRLKRDRLIRKWEKRKD